MRNVNWPAVIERMTAVCADRPLPQGDPSDKSLPSLSIEELSAQLAKGELGRRSTGDAAGGRLEECGDDMMVEEAPA